MIYEPYTQDRDFEEKLKFLLSVIPPPPPGYLPWEFRGIEYSFEEYEKLICIQRRPESNFSLSDYKRNYERGHSSWFWATQIPPHSMDQEYEYVFVCKQDRGESTTIPIYEIS